MATQKVDTVPEIMNQEHGTTVLITDRAADKFLDKSAKHGKERYARWCGGKKGFDDYAERLH
jgi:hypothetical protein